MIVERVVEWVRDFWDHPLGRVALAGVAVAAALGLAVYWTG